MNDLLRSFGRALSSALHPVMLFLTFAPFAVAAIFWGGLLYLFWQPLLDATRIWLDNWQFTSTLYHLFDWLGFGALRAVVAPFVVIAMAIPLSSARADSNAAIRPTGKDRFIHPGEDT